VNKIISFDLFTANAPVAVFSLTNAQCGVCTDKRRQLGSPSNNEATEASGRVPPGT